MKICIAGKNSIAVNSVKFLLEDLNFNKSDIFVCVNKNDTGKDNWQPSLKQYATEEGLKIVRLEELYELNDLYFFSLEYDKIIDPEKFNSNRLFNLHFSLLPAYKGVYTSAWPLLNGESQTGVTLHKIDKGIDTGPILFQEEIPIDINETCRDLYLKYLSVGDNFFKSKINQVLSLNYQEKPQKAERASYYAKNSIDYSQIDIDYNKTSFEIHNQIRAFIFKEYQLPIVKGKKIGKSILTNEFVGINKVSLQKDFLIISGIDGFKLKLHIIQ